MNQLDVLERILVVSPENQPAFPLPKNIQLILNHQWQEGQSSSIRLELNKLGELAIYTYLVINHC